MSKHRITLDAAKERLKDRLQGVATLDVEAIEKGLSAQAAQFFDELRRDDIEVVQADYSGPWGVRMTNARMKFRKDSNGIASLLVFDTEWLEDTGPQYEHEGADGLVVLGRWFRCDMYLLPRSGQPSLLISRTGNGDENVDFWETRDKWAPPSGGYILGGNRERKEGLRWAYQRAWHLGYHDEIGAL